MHLVRALIAASGPFDRIEVPFADDEGHPRALTVVHGTGGVGKTTLLQAIATTRPGHAVAQMPRSDGHTVPAQGPPHVACDWLLGNDEPGRPHPLRVASPNVRLLAQDEDEALRRREQAHFDKLAQEGGFAFVSVPAVRWFSRQPIVLSAPARTVARYDVRTPLALDDASRADLSRETKQALVYAAVSSALAGPAAEDGRRFDLLGEAMRAAVDRLAALAGVRYTGVDPLSFEPWFAEHGGRRLSFDALPTRARHLIAFAALSTRVLWAAYPDQDPRESEGVVTIDDVELHQDTPVLSRLASALREALPGAQWILTTASPVLAASSAVSDVVALRRLRESDAVAVFAGEQALTH
jgi:hypothetical protein